MKLSENFTLAELTRSTSCPHVDNTPLPPELDNLKALVTNVLQPLRDLYNKPMTINSGYRNAEVNRAVGGKPSSQHTKGEAVDVRSDNPKLLLDLMRMNGIEFDQVGLYNNFIHISYKRNGNNRKMVFYGKY